MFSTQTHFARVDIVQAFDLCRRSTALPQTPAVLRRATSRELTKILRSDCEMKQRTKEPPRRAVRLHLDLVVVSLVLLLREKMLHVLKRHNNLKKISTYLILTSVV